MERIGTRARQLRDRLYGTGDAFDCGLSDEDLYTEFDEELEYDDLDEEFS